MSLRNQQVIADLPFNVKPWNDITDTLPCLLPDPEPIRTIEEITHLSVHHSGVEGGTIQGYANYHVKELKWHHIGYHNVIKTDQLYQTNDWLTKSYHTSSNNAYTLSCSISGDLSKRPMSDVERNNLYAWALTCLSIFPNLKVEYILGHNEYPDNKKTICPATDMFRVRDDIAKLQGVMQRNGSWQKKMDNISFMGKQFKYLNSNIGLGEKDGNAQWAASVYMDIFDYMKSKSYL